MTPEEAREHMDAALDGELTLAEQRAFDAALGADPSLREDYARLREWKREACALREVPTSDGLDLLAGVQRRLRERSGGRFYRDRFSQAHGRAGATIWMLALAVLVLLAVSGWLAFDLGLVQAPQPTP